MHTIPHTRGATLRQRYRLPAQNSRYTTITARVARGDFSAELAVRRLPDTDEIEISATAAATATWPLRQLACAIRMTVGAEAAVTERFFIHMLPEV